MIKLIKTTNNNVIIRDEEIKKLHVVLGKDLTVVSSDKIENYGQCLFLSRTLPVMHAMQGNLEEAIKKAQEMLKDTDS